MSSPFNSDNDDMCSLLQQAYEHRVFHYDLFNRLHFMSQSTISRPSNLIFMHTNRRNFVNQYFPDKQAKAYYWLNHHHHHQCRNRSRTVSIVIVSVSSAHISVFFINKSFAIRVESPFPSLSAFSQSSRFYPVPFVVTFSTHVPFATIPRGVSSLRRVFTLKDYKKLNLLQSSPLLAHGVDDD